MQTASNKKPSHPPSTTDPSRLEGRTEHISSMTSRAVQTVDDSLPATLSRNTTTVTESDLDYKSKEHVSEEPELRMSEDANEVPDPFLENPQTSSLSSVKVTAATDNFSLSVFPFSTVSKILWDKAYSTNRRRHRRLVNEYETILSLDLDITASNRRKPAETSYIAGFENIIDQTDPSVREVQMKSLLDAWLYDRVDVVKDDNGDVISDDNEDQLTPEGKLPAEWNCVNTKNNSLEAIHKPISNQHGESLRRILRQAVRDTPPEAVLAWVAACYSSKV